MAGQGSVTNTAAKLLQQSGWTIVYKCIPNTPHIHVVPIPTLFGPSRQRYPDIVAIKDGVTRFIEVEIKLTEQVALDIEQRFSDFVGSLCNKESWDSWTTHIFNELHITMPDSFNPQCDLLICSKLPKNHESFTTGLGDAGIIVSTLDTFL